MKKSDLKTGMWVKTKHHLWTVVVIENEPFLIYPEGWMPIEDFPHICSTNANFDILEVYKYNGDIAGGMQYNTWKNRLYDSKMFTKIYPIKPKETIKIGEVVYDKAEFEEAVKNLKQINK